VKRVRADGRAYVKSTAAVFRGRDRKRDVAIRPDVGNSEISILRESVKIDRHAGAMALNPLLTLWTLCVELCFRRFVKFTITAARYCAAMQHGIRLRSAPLEIPDNPDNYNWMIIYCA